MRYDVFVKPLLERTTSILGWRQVGEYGMLPMYMFVLYIYSDFSPLHFFS